MAILSFNNVSLRFAEAERDVLSQVNYQVEQGDFIIVLGSNGSGKSSLLKLIDRRYQPSSGSIMLDNKPLAGFSAREFSQSVKTLTQNTHESLFNSLTVYENYLMIASGSHKSRAEIKHYWQKFNSNLADKLDQVVEQLSGGEKQALALSLMVLNPPRILLLDEHTSALDPVTADTIMALTQEIIAQSGITCLLATHDLSIAEQYGSRILAMKNGSIHHLVNQQDKMQATQDVLLAACY